MDVEALLRRFARDHWVRLHDTPRVTVLAGDDELLAVYRSWLAFGPTNVALFANGEIAGLVRDACAAASARPRETVAIHASADAIASWRRGRGDRLAAMVAEGLVEVTSDARATSPPSPLPRSPARSFDARSAAEAAMFEALEATPATTGRFALNEKLSVRFGPAACEVDLLSRRDAIAIEVDGYHHFGDRDRYRRDREKDLLLQAQGLIVIRVLAEDVIADPRPAIHLVRQALAARLGGSR